MVTNHASILVAPVVNPIVRDHTNVSVLKIGRRKILTEDGNEIEIAPDINTGTTGTGNFIIILTPIRTTCPLFLQNC